jgi:hypothetical protein
MTLIIKMTFSLILHTIIALHTIFHASHSDSCVDPHMFTKMPLAGSAPGSHAPGIIYPHIYIYIYFWQKVFIGPRGPTFCRGSNGASGTLWGAYCRTYLHLHARYRGWVTLLGGVRAVFAVHVLSQLLGKTKKNTIWRYMIPGAWSPPVPPPAARNLLPGPKIAEKGGYKRPARPSCAHEKTH